ncbi:hypothetical protein L1787_06850 [Acuticoccus sp. M5D2P5]|uniref:hypothetical protein n=1 Tax=Acuticoccus kalidii TaxID=2910977 RepID=UPI001F16244C|nr:hypothetical protein [Acuticoccus kalidii]MCF3933132.1 hypothetical protein [Acuticoccus kalidii]
MNISVRPPKAIASIALSFAAAGMVAACTTSTPPSTPKPRAVASEAEAEQPEPVIGKWAVYPAVGTSDRSCSMDFSTAAFKTDEGRVWTVACNLVDGLGGINGINRVTKWERKGRTIILSGIATPNIATMELPRDSGRNRIQGLADDGTRFVLVRN